MSAAAVARAARGGLSRRRLQTTVIGLVVLVSTAATVLALGLVAVSNAPFEHAFAAQRGADDLILVNLSGRGDKDIGRC